MPYFDAPAAKALLSAMAESVLRLTIIVIGTIYAVEVNNVPDSLSAAASVSKSFAAQTVQYFADHFFT